jgi:hypothetical protein
MALRRTHETAELALELSTERGAPYSGAEALAFDAAATIAAPAERRTAELRELAPHTLAYFGSDADALARLGYGALATAHSSDALRAEQLAQREAEELLARRIVFGTAVALAGLCAAAWLIAIVRRGSLAVPPAWRFASGAAALALVFSLVAARLWWSSPTLASPPPAGLPAPLRSPSEMLRALGPEALAGCEIPIALATRSAGEGRLSFPAGSFSGSARLAVRVVDADGALHRRELELPER